jgi:hypothetical protein
VNRSSAREPLGIGIIGTLQKRLCGPAAAPEGLTFPDIPGLVYGGEPPPNRIVLPHSLGLVGALNCSSDARSAIR